MSRRFQVAAASTTIVLAFAVNASESAGAEGKTHLGVSDRSAVPGQVILLSGPRVTKKPRVKIGGKKAKIVSKNRGKLGVEVPKLKPGKAGVVVRAGGRRLKGGLKIERGFSGDVKPKLEGSAAVSAEIGPAGGVVAATRSDGDDLRAHGPSRGAHCR